MRLLASIAAALALTSGTTDTCSHEAPSGWDYPFECCSGADCAQIDPKTVKANSSGFIVTVVPGQHPIWTKDRRQTLILEIAYRKARLSPDGKWHLCINDAGDLLCFFAPAGGS